MGEKKIIETRDVAKEPVRPVVVDYTLEEELKRGSVIAEDLINKLREKYEKKQNPYHNDTKVHT